MGQRRTPKNTDVSDAAERGGFPGLVMTPRVDTVGSVSDSFVSMNLRPFGGPAAGGTISVGPAAYSLGTFLSQQQIGDPSGSTTYQVTGMVDSFALSAGVSTLNTPTEVRLRASYSLPVPDDIVEEIHFKGGPSDFTAWSGSIDTTKSVGTGGFTTIFSGNSPRYSEGVLFSYYRQGAYRQQVAYPLWFEGDLTFDWSVATPNGGPITATPNFGFWFSLGVGCEVVSIQNKVFSIPK